VATPYLSEIRIMSFNFAPTGWAQCTGTLLPINQNQALFSLLGTYYGGDGRTTFALPNLAGRTPIHMSPQYLIGQQAGEVAHTLTTGEVPLHTHAVMGTPTDGDSPIADGNYLGAADNMYGPLTNPAAIQPSTVTNAGGSQPHLNMQPYMVLNFCIALLGAYPSQN
jgi:microcystin-dependent protein